MADYELELRTPSYGSEEPIVLQFWTDGTLNTLKFYSSDARKLADALSKLADAADIIESLR